jgi:hypothetical protein
MTIRNTESRGRDGRLARLQAENARLRRLAEELAADVGELDSGRSTRRRHGAVDPAHRLLAGAPPRE